MAESPGHAGDVPPRYRPSRTNMASVVRRSAAASEMCLPRWASTSRIRASSTFRAALRLPRSAAASAAFTFCSRLLASSRTAEVRRGLAYAAGDPIVNPDALGKGLL
jgi:hypothetical protein